MSKQYRGDRMAESTTEARRRWMRVLARASAADLAAALEGSADRPAYTRLRGPEAGLVMVRGRAGGGGDAFNLGEMTVTRCSVRLADGTVGHAYVAGRDSHQAELAAVCDALLLREPGGGLASAVDTMAAAQQARRQSVAAKAAATKVQFFAMETWRGGLKP
jgi:alpha-D-ribose 1-methylphosphonate 5-triphosphate synthase subunit PhnG